MAAADRVRLPLRPFDGLQHFILARMREAYDRTGSTDTAVVEGNGRTGRLVTSATLILFLTFVSMATAPSIGVKILATGFGAGILLDATIVRALLLPGDRLPVRPLELVATATPGPAGPARPAFK